MQWRVDLTTPFTDPVLIFALVLIIILVSPLLLNRFRIPGIVGMIIAGVIIGPYGFHLLDRPGPMHVFGTVGLLYIMFLAGLEIDMFSFRRNSSRTVVFGLLTFAIPLIAGFLLGYYVLEYNFISSLLIAILFSTQTMVAYPIVSKLGITKSSPVIITIGGTIITDTLVLLVLAVISNYVAGESTWNYWITFTLVFIGFLAVVVILFPLISRWIFKNLAGEGGSQFIFVLTAVFFAALLAQVAGVEPIIGAFLAGLSMNRLIPVSSPLKNRIEFVGANIFIPFFLISVGMLVDLNVLFEGLDSVRIAGLLVLTALLTKFVAAWVTQKIFGFSNTERNLVYGLSTAHAAAMLAIALVGFNLGIIDEPILNGTILVILISSLVSSFITESSGRKYILQQKHMEIIEHPDDEKILVTISNPQTITGLIDLALLLREKNNTDLIYALAVADDDEKAREKIAENKRMLKSATDHAASADIRVEVITRVDLNISFGISRTMKELDITELIMGWSGKSAADKIFGSILDNVLPTSTQMVYVCKLIHAFNHFKRICVFIPVNAEFESGFVKWVRNIKLIASYTGCRCVFYGSLPTLHIIDDLNRQKQSLKVSCDFNEFSGFSHLDTVYKELEPSDLVVAISARTKTISWNHDLERIPAKLAKEFSEFSFLIIYPDQRSMTKSEADFEKEIENTLTRSEKRELMSKFKSIPGSGDRK